MQSGRFSTPKSYPRSARAETRNRAKDELKRVINAVERVRKWEKRWILLKDSAVYVYKWVPVSGSTPAAKPATTAQKTAALLNERANSAENSNDASNTPSNSHFGLNEESNTAFSEGFRKRLQPHVRSGRTRGTLERRVHRLQRNGARGDGDQGRTVETRKVIISFVFHSISAYLFYRLTN
ncbi:BCL7-like protein C28H8.1 [Aphelenchoides fujianensis]|nr:BCL7-like protein C28H8.1 [Aphelenchoides fujianensis]